MVVPCVVRQRDTFMEGPAELETSSQRPPVPALHSFPWNNYCLSGGYLLPLPAAMDMLEARVVSCLLNYARSKEPCTTQSWAEFPANSGYV